MSSKIRINKICQFCNTEFVAKTTVTKYCSTKCASKAGKDRKRTNKIKQSQAETDAIKAQTSIYASVNSKDILTVKDAALLLNCSLRTTYRLINTGAIRAVRISERKTLVRRSDIDGLFDNAPKIVKQCSHAVDFSETYTIGEIEQNFNISGKALYELIKKERVPKQKRGKFTHVPKSIIDKFLS